MESSCRVVVKTDTELKGMIRSRRREKIEKEVGGAVNSVSEI